MSMRVLVTGATGFTGSHVVPLLLRSNYQVRCFIRKNSATNLHASKVDLCFGDLDDRATLSKALQGVDALLNIASLGFGHAPAIVRCAEEAGVRRSIFVSTTAVATSLNAPSKKIRLAAEDAIRTSKLAYTILRPTMIYGTARDRNMSRLIRYLNRWPIIPVIGDGERLQQPVYVEDVANAVVASMSCEAAVGRTYDISGAAPVTYNRLIDIVCGLMNRKVRKIHIPVTPTLTLFSAVECMGLRLPIKSEQILRLNEDKMFGHEAATTDFGYRPLSIEEGIRQELELMNLISGRPGKFN